MKSKMNQGGQARPGGARKRWAAGVGIAAVAALVPGLSSAAPTHASDRPALAEAGMGSTAVSAAVNGKGEENVFWRSTTDVLWNNWFENGRWGTPSEVPNTNNGPARNVASPPTSATDVDGDVNVFWKGTNGGLYQSYISEHGGFAGWGAIQQLPGEVVGGSVAAVADPTGGLNVFFVGPDGQLLNDYSNSHSVWNTSPGLVSTGGDLSAGATLSAVAPSGGQHVMDVFWKGTDDALWDDAYYGGAWHGPNDLGGTLGTAPVATSMKGGGEAVFYRNTAGKLDVDYLTGSDWSGAVQLGPDDIGSSIQALEGSSTAEANVVFSSDGRFWLGRLVGGKWTASAVADDNAIGVTSAVTTSTGTIDVLYAASGPALWHVYSTAAGTWQGPVRISSLG